MSFADTFAPPRWLRHAHLQSVLPSLKLRRPLVAQRARNLLINAREYILDCGDGVRLMGLYSAQPRVDGAAAPMVVLMHGWEGSADSLYLLSLGGALYARGFDVFRLNFRDHGPTHHLNRDIFHSCRIAEVVGAVRAVQDAFAPPQLSLAGFSLGGNFALRVAVRAPQAGITLHKAVAVCPVLHPKTTLAALERGWFVYQRYFIHKWKNSLRIKQRCFPDVYDFSEILRMQSLNDMTEVLVRRYSEFPDLSTYLNGYAIVDGVLANLQVNSHVFLAEDDPIIPVRDVQALARTPHLSVNTIRHGGHCGFVERLNAESWVDRAVARVLSE